MGQKQVNEAVTTELGQEEEKARGRCGSEASAGRAFRESGGVFVGGGALSGKWVFTRHPNFNWQQCLRQRRCGQSGAIRFCPHPGVGHVSTGACAG